MFARLTLLIIAAIIFVISLITDPSTRWSLVGATALAIIIGSMVFPHGSTPAPRRGWLGRRMAYVAVALVLAAAYFVAIETRPHMIEGGCDSSCSRMHQLACALVEWSEAHADNAPPDLQTLVRDEALSPRLLMSADAHAHPPSSPFLYVRPGDVTTNTPMILEDPSLHHGASMSVCYADGSTETMHDRARIAAVWAEAKRLAACDAARTTGVDTAAWSAAVVDRDR